MKTSLKVAAFILLIVTAIAGFAALIPQIESPAPETLEISGELSGVELAAVGRQVFESAEAGCLACHGLGREGLRAPDLAGIGLAAEGRIAGVSAEDYLRQSIADPCAFVIAGYDCIMPQTMMQALGEDKVTALIAFLQSQGGEITVSLAAGAGETPPSGGPAGPPGVPGVTAEEIIAALGCAGCHTLEAVGAAGQVGPDLSQLGGRLAADEIRQSILDPDAVIAADCPGGPCPAGVMPKGFGDRLTAAQLETLVQFLSALGETSE